MRGFNGPIDESLLKAIAQHAKDDLVARMEPRIDAAWAEIRPKLIADLNSAISVSATQSMDRFGIEIRVSFHGFGDARKAE